MTGRDRHELSCAACGAPLHDLKMLRKDKLRPKREPMRTEHITRPKKKKKKVKRRKSLFSRVLDEAWDAIEDVFD